MNSLTARGVDQEQQKAKAKKSENRTKGAKENERSDEVPYDDRISDATLE